MSGDVNSPFQPCHRFGYEVKTEGPYMKDKTDTVDFAGDVALSHT